MGFAFAHHINPDAAVPAMRAYREDFSPAATLKQPHAILTVSAIVAETQERAEELATSIELTMLRLRSGRPGLLPSPAEAMAYPYTAAERAQIQGYRSHYLIGTPSKVHAQLSELAAQTAADEVMITTMVHEHAARLRSYELLAEAFELPRPAQAHSEHVE
jgi:luciferase family oxidoreductase group 1